MTYINWQAFTYAVLTSLTISSTAGASIATGFLVNAYDVANFGSSAVLSLAFAPDGGLFASNGINLSTVPLSGGASSFESLRPPIASNQATGDIKFDSAGNLYFSDFGASTLLRRTPSGIVETFATDIFRMRAMAFDTSGNLLVVGGGGAGDIGYVKSVSSSGAVSTIVSAIGSPWDIAVAPDGTIYVLDAFANVYSVTASSGIVPFVSLPSPLGESLAIDSSGNLFVGTDDGFSGGMNRGRVFRVRPSGEVNVLGQDIGEGLSLELVFGPNGDLFIGNFKAQGPSNNVLRISGDFDGEISGVPDVNGQVPEPYSLIVWAILALTIAMALNWRLEFLKASL